MNSGIRTGLVVFTSAAVTMATILLLALGVASTSHASGGTTQAERAVTRAVQQNVDLEMKRRLDAARQALQTGQR